MKFVPLVLNKDFIQLKTSKYSISYTPISVIIQESLLFIQKKQRKLPIFFSRIELLRHSQQSKSRQIQLSS